MELRSEGIILYVVPFQDRHEIATVFGAEGKLSLIRKWGRSSKKAPLSPLTRCEFVYRPGTGDISNLSEITVLDAYLPLRASLDLLESAMECLSIINKTQQVNQKSDKLYLMLTLFLENLPKAKDPRTIVTTFYLKVLLHEGLLPLEKLSLEMAQLTASRSLSELSSIQMPPEVYQQTKALFIECIA